MRTRTFMTIALLLLTGGSIFAQDPPDGYGRDLGDDVYSGELAHGETDVWLIPLGLKAPEHRILKGTGLGLRQITDWVLYEHFPLADQTGMVVENVLSNLPAHKAGIRWHDVIAKVDGKSISSVDDFIAAYNACKTDEVPVEIIQKGQSKTVKIAKTDVAKWEKDYRIGVHVDSIPKELAMHLGFDAKEKPGLYISSVVAGSPAEKAGLKAGDLLLKANETPLKSSDVLNNIVRESQGRELSLEYLRAGKTHHIKLTAAEQTMQAAKFLTLNIRDPRPYMRPAHVGLEGFGPLAGIHPRNSLNWFSPIPSLEGFGPLAGIHPAAPQDSRAESAALQRLVEAVEQLSKDVAELRSELKKKE